MTVPPGDRTGIEDPGRWMTDESKNQRRLRIQRWGQRDDTGEHYTYINDPDGNLIELVYHPLGLADADGHKVETPTHPRGLRWRQLPEVEAALGTGPAS